MADGGFDPCECIWSHEAAMQRLMNLLRNSQSTCTDSVCVSELPGPQSTPADGGYSMMFFLMGWIVVATALFLLRPSSLRRNRGDQKPDNQGGPNGPPPPAVH